MKARRTLPLLLALLLLIAGCAPAADSTTSPAVSGIKTGGTLVMSAAAEPISLNPNGTYDSGNGYLVQNVFNRLIKMNSMQQVIPDLAHSYDVSADGLTYTFNLNKEVYFHDGEKMTSDDVKFTFDYIKENQTFASYTMANVASVECPNDDTVVFHMSSIDASFLYNLAYQGTYILPRHVYEGKDWSGADAVQTPVGTGPFVYDSWDKGTRITLTRNSKFFLGPDLPYLDKVIFSFVSDGTTAKTGFLAGDADILGVFSSADFNEMREHGSIDMQVNIYPSRFIVEFNMLEAPFDNVDVRKAVAYAIDNEELMTMALKETGLEAKHYLSPLFDWAVDKTLTLPGYDLDKAKELIAGAGLTADSNGNYLSVTVDTMNYAPFPDVAQVFKSQMAKIGIDVTINMLEYASFDEKVVQNKNFQIGITSDYQGPEVSAIANSISSAGYLNAMGYVNAEVDALLEQAVNLASFEERAPLYKQVQKFMNDDLPYYIISEWVGYYPHWNYVKNHPASEGARDASGYGEFTRTWLDK